MGADEYLTILEDALLPWMLKYYDLKKMTLANS